MELSGKKALVTGSSRGIGRELALALAKKGAAVAIHYHSDRESAYDVKSELDALGAKCVLVQANLTDCNCAEIMWKELEKNDFSDIDILVLNASMQSKVDWENIDAQDFDNQMHANVLASVKLIQKAVPHMKTNHWGRIVTIGSIHEGKPSAKMLIYGASKTAQTTVVYALSQQLAADGITVNNIAPGVILTDRNRAPLSNAEFRDQVMARVPAGYFGSTQDCVGALLLFCTDAGRYITGQSLYIDGGMLRSR